MAHRSETRHIGRLLGWLRDRELDFELAARCVGFGVWQWNLITNEMVWSDRCREILGIGPEGTPSLEYYLSFVHPDDRERVARNSDNVRSERAPHDNEYRIVRPDGEVRWVHSAWRTQFERHGADPVRALGVILDVTERRRATEARARHDAHLQHFIDATPAGVAMLDRELRFLVTNRRFIADTGLGDTPIIGRSIYEVFPAQPVHWRDAHQRALAGHTEHTYSERWLHPDGSVRWVNRTLFPWYDERGEMGGIVLINEMLSPQQYLEAQGRLWAEAFLHNTRGIAVVDPATNEFRSVNATGAQLAGFSPEELRGHSMLTVYPATEHSRLLAAGLSADTGGTAILQTCQLHRDGTLIPVELSVVSVRDAGGRVSSRIVTVSDLRERLRVEGELRHTEAQLIAAERFRQLVDSAPIGILLLDTDGACNYANACWLEIAGLHIEQARDLGWWDAIHPDDRDRVSEAWERLTQGSHLDLEFRYQREGGEVQWVHALASPLRDDSGATVGYISVDVDITEQLSQRAAIDRFHGRVRSLAHRLERLREEERGELARKLHGTLRQDMTTLKMEIEALRHPLHAPEQTPERAARLAELADRCLDRLRHIAFELHPPGIEDLGLMGALKRYGEEVAAQSGLRVEIISNGALPDLGQRRLIILYRTFQEALSNVVRHAHAKRVDVHISVHERSLRLRMTDDGIGMGEKDRNKTGAFGLLAASERLAQIGGTLRVFGVAGQGTTLDASVPIRRGGRKRDTAEGA